MENAVLCFSYCLAKHDCCTDMPIYRSTYKYTYQILTNLSMGYEHENQHPTKIKTYEFGCLLQYENLSHEI